MKPLEDIAPDATPDRYAVLRVRDFQLYLIGRFIASFGQQMLGTPSAGNSTNAQTPNSRWVSWGWRRSRHWSC